MFQGDHSGHCLQDGVEAGRIEAVTQAAGHRDPHNPAPPSPESVSPSLGLLAS